MRSSLTVSPARSDELAAAFDLVFQRLPNDERRNRAAVALRLIQAGDLLADGVLAARNESRLVGALVCLPLPGASALFWPAQSAPNDPAVEDALTDAARAWLRGRGVKLAQALLAPEETALAAPLLRNGFSHATGLWYLRRTFDRLAAPPRTQDASLTYQPYPAVDPALFRQILGRTYEGTLDCPEVNGVRTTDEVIAGYRAPATHDPSLWWLALYGRTPIGVLLTTPVSDTGGWDLSYVGVVPELRRRGLGGALMRKALAEAHRAKAVEITLSVDERNHPARELYRRLGFRPYDRREVYLAIWQ